MPVTVTCRCAQKLNVPDNAVGKQVRCPRCKRTISIQFPKPMPPVAPIQRAIPVPPVIPAQPVIPVQPVSAVKNPTYGFDELPTAANPHKTPPAAPRNTAGWQTVARVFAVCLGLIAISLPVVIMIMDSKLDPAEAIHNDGIGRVAYASFVASLVGIPCLLIAYKGIRVDSHSMQVRGRGLILTACGVGVLVLAGLVTAASILMADVIGVGGGIVTTGLILTGVGIIYVGLLTAIMGVDLQEEMRR